MQAPGSLSMPELAQEPEQELSCNRPGYRKTSGTKPVPEPEPTSGLQGQEPRHAGQGRGPPNVPTEAG